jgi:hypothetical protein
VDSLEDFLPNCIRLENLIVTGRCLSEVEHLPSSLVTLEIDMEWEMEFVPLLLDLLEPSKVMAAKALEELHLISQEYSHSPGRGPHGMRYKVETVEGWSEVKEACRQKKIQLFLGGLEDSGR